MSEFNNPFTEREVDIKQEMVGLQGIRETQQAYGPDTSDYQTLADLAETKRDQVLDALGREGLQDLAQYYGNVQERIRQLGDVVVSTTQAETTKPLAGTNEVRQAALSEAAYMIKEADFFFDEFGVELTAGELGSEAEKAKEAKTTEEKPTTEEVSEPESIKEPEPDTVEVDEAPEDGAEEAEDEDRETTDEAKVEKPFDIYSGKELPSEVQQLTPDNIISQAPEDIVNYLSNIWVTVDESIIRLNQVQKYVLASVAAYEPDDALSKDINHTVQLEELVGDKCKEAFRETAKSLVEVFSSIDGVVFEHNGGQTLGSGYRFRDVSNRLRFLGEVSPKSKDFRTRELDKAGGVEPVDEEAEPSGAKVLAAELNLSDDSSALVDLLLEEKISQANLGQFIDADKIEEVKKEIREWAIVNNLILKESEGKLWLEEATEQPGGEKKQNIQRVSEEEVESAIDELQGKIVEKGVFSVEDLERFYEAEVIGVEVSNSDVRFSEAESRVLYLLFSSRKMVRAEHIKWIMSYCGLDEMCQEEVGSVGFSKFVNDTLDRIDGRLARKIQLATSGKGRGKKYKLKDPNANLVFMLNGDPPLRSRGPKEDVEHNFVKPDERERKELRLDDEAEGEDSGWVFEPEDVAEGRQTLTLPDGTDVTLREDEMKVLGWLHGSEKRSHSFLQRKAHDEGITTPRLNVILDMLDNHNQLKVKIVSKGSGKRLRYFSP